MNVHECKEKLSIQISHIEEEESRLQEWMHCLQKVQAIAAEWNDLSSESDLASVAQGKETQHESGLADPLHEVVQTSKEERQPEGEIKPACWDQESCHRNFERLRQNAEQEKENQRLQEREFEQLREQLCASRPKNSISGRLGMLMSFLMKV